MILRYTLQQQRVFIDDAMNTMDYKQPIDLEKEEVTHIELSNLDQSRAAPSSIPYPAALHGMAEPPDMRL